MHLVSILHAFYSPSPDGPFLYREVLYDLESTTDGLMDVMCSHPDIMCSIILYC